MTEKRCDNCKHWKDDRCSYLRVTKNGHIMDAGPLVDRTLPYLWPPVNFYCPFFERQHCYTPCFEFTHGQVLRAVKRLQEYSDAKESSPEIDEQRLCNRAKNIEGTLEQLCIVVRRLTDAYLNRKE